MQGDNIVDACSVLLRQPSVAKAHINAMRRKQLRRSVLVPPHEQQRHRQQQQQQLLQQVQQPEHGCAALSPASCW